MRQLRKLIGSTNTLFTFEAAARHRSFTEAANEMGVTQAAVSHSIKNLELRLGVNLFQREHRHLSLTVAGQQFYQDVSLGLGHIVQSASSISHYSNVGHVTLSCSTAFASHWILPKLPIFRNSHPDIDFRIQTSDRDVDIIAEKISLGVRHGDGTWSNYESRKLADEILMPVCSPTFLKNSGPINSARELSSQPLIHLEEPFRPRPTWKDWFNHHKIRYRDENSGLRLNDYALVIQAAIGGQGVALGWAHLVANALKQGLLVSPVNEIWATSHSFYIVSPKNSSISEDVEKVRNWILDDSITD